MKRKRLTQVFPKLLPLRVKQKELFYEWKLNLHSLGYSKVKRENILKSEVTRKKALLINEESGYDIEYQYNKKENIKIASSKINRVVIKPGETFSFWYLVGRIHPKYGYKKGLCISNGQMSYNYGGGLCLLSNFLYELFLETPLTVIERHPHAYESFKPKDGEILGLDATIMYGWLDLKVKNNTQYTFQILVETDDTYLHGAIMCTKPLKHRMEIIEKNGHFEEINQIRYYDNDIVRLWKNNETNQIDKEETLYHNHIEVRFYSFVTCFLL